MLKTIPRTLVVETITIVWALGGGGVMGREDLSEKLGGVTNGKVFTFGGAEA